MFEFTVDIGNSLYNRYKTIEKNIEAKSNTFYDSTLSFLEEFVRTIAIKEDLVVDDSLSFVKFISQENFSEFVLEKCNLSKSDFQEIYSISKLVNDHKHNTQRDINVDEVVSILRSVHSFMISYHKISFKNGDYIFQAKNLYDAFGKTEKDIENLKKQRNKLERSLRDENSRKALLIDDMNKLESLTNEEKLKRQDLEQQKEILTSEVSKLKDIKLTTMEEKVARIVDILDKQTEVLESMEEFLGSINKKTKNQNQILNNNFPY